MEGSRERLKEMFIESRSHFLKEETILLKSGREILIDGIYIHYTYSEILVGDPVECSEEIRGRLRSKILDQFPHFKPLHIFDEGARILPAYTCVADVWSDPITPEKHGSCLHICWFSNDIQKPIPLIVRDILDRIVWEDWAEDFIF